MDSLKSLTHKRIFRTILLKEEISRVEISKELNLSRATVTGIVKDLIENGLIEEKKVGESKKKLGGKKPIILGVNNKTSFVIGVEIFDKKLQCFLLNLEGTVKESLELRFASEPSPQEICEKVSKTVKRFKTKLTKNNGNTRILAIGISMGAAIDSSSGTILYSLFPNIKNFPLAKLIEEKTGIPTYIEDRPVINALREYWDGEAKGTKNFVFLQVLPFIRAVLFLNGDIYYGTNYIAGQIGSSLSRISVNTDEQEYLCDLIDNEIFKMPKIVNKINLESRPNPFDETYYNRQRLTIEEFLKKIEKNGDISSQMIPLSRVVGQVVTNLIFYYDPELIVFGGIPEKFQTEFLENVKSEIKRLLYSTSIDKYRISFEKTDPNLRMKGFLCMIMSRFTE